MAACREDGFFTGVSLQKRRVTKTLREWSEWSETGNRKSEICWDALVAIVKDEGEKNPVELI